MKRYFSILLSTVLLLSIASSCASPKTITITTTPDSVIKAETQNTTITETKVLENTITLTNTTTITYNPYKKDYDVYDPAYLEKGSFKLGKSDLVDYYIIDDCKYIKLYDSELLEKLGLYKSDDLLSDYNNNKFDLVNYVGVFDNMIRVKQKKETQSSSLPLVCLDDILNCFSHITIENEIIIVNNEASNKAKEDWFKYYYNNSKVTFDFLTYKTNNTKTYIIDNETYIDIRHFDVFDTITDSENFIYKNKTYYATRSKTYIYNKVRVKTFDKYVIYNLKDICKLIPNICISSTELIINDDETKTGNEYIDKYISLDELLENARTKKEEINSRENPFDELKQKLIINKEDASLITAEEITKLKSDNKQPNSITYSQAVDDVDLFFRALKYGYGAYYYVGGDTLFFKIKQSILDELEGLETISYDNFYDLIQKYTALIPDSHFQIGNNTYYDKYRYKCYFDESQEYAKDENGYYKYIDNQKWYYAGCENEYVSMQPILNNDGYFVYSIVKFSPVLYGDNSTITFNDNIKLTSSNKIIYQTINWTLSEELGYINSSIDGYTNSNGISYFYQRGFNTIKGDEITQNKISEYISYGKSSKNSNAIIIDYRSNSGGGWNNVYNSFNKGLTDKDTQIIQYSIEKHTALNGKATFGNEKYVKDSEICFENGFILNNTIPVFILADNSCASGGEGVLLSTYSLDNSIIIGSNSAGYQISTTSNKFSLPNSGISCIIDGYVKKCNNSTNVDLTGYSPDVWCNPIDAYNRTLKMLVNYGLASSDDIKAFISE